jgi:hypothetical protein
MKMKVLFGIVLAAALAFGTACTNKQGQTESPVVITVNMDLQPGFIDVNVSAPVQVQTITLESHFKDAVSIDPQHFSDFECSSYTVAYRRTDGGTLVPPLQTFGCGILVPSNGTATLTNFPVLAASSLQASPFDQLQPFNGGIDRETGKDEIDTAFDITFFGSTVSGHRVQSETASGLLLFRSLGGGAAGMRTAK